MKRPAKPTPAKGTCLAPVPPTAADVQAEPRPPAPWVPPGSGEEVEADARGYEMNLALAAVTLGVLPPVLAKWRKQGIGPSFRRGGTQNNAPIFYSALEIKAVRKDMEAARAAETKAQISARIDQANVPTKQRAKRRKKAP